MKNHRIEQLVKSQSSVLQQKSFDNYVKFLNQLCKDHSGIDEISTIQRLVKSKDWDNVLATVDSWSLLHRPKHEFYVLSQFAALIKKYPWGKLVKADPEGLAKKKFFAAEHSCHRINQRFIARRTCRPSLNEDSLSKMRRFITYVIGNTPPIKTIFSNSAFGPGASLGVSRSTNFARKLLADSWSVTPGAFIYSYVAIMENVHFRAILSPDTAPFYYGDAEFAFEREQYRKKTLLVKHNNIAFVPKTAKVHRTIAIEPLLNGYLQKGTDIVLRLCLKRIGINLEDQSLNQEMARQGSLPEQEDPFVTIDLSSASDSIAYEVVKELLPPDWFEFLNSIRSHQYKMGNTLYEYNKFCSMGNGFCFPLETLIFAAACTAVGAGKPGKDFMVYGDDIIVRRSVAEPLISLLGFMGFKINSDKTFLEGPFRESCGADWYAGEDIRPFTLDFALDSVQNVFKALNLSRRNERTTQFFHRSRLFLVNLLPSSLRFFRPYPGPADTGIDSIGDEFLYTDNAIYKHRERLWYCRSIITEPIQDRFWIRSGLAPQALMWGALVGAASTAPFAFRGKTRTKVRFTACSEATSKWLPPV